MSTGDNYQLTGQLKVSDAEAREHEAAVLAKRFIKIPSNQQVQIDYDVRTDGQPVYIGTAPRSLSTSVTGWLLQKITYNGSSYPTSITIAYDSWANRSTASYG